MDGWEALLIAYMFNMTIYRSVLEWMYFLNKQMYWNQVSRAGKQKSWGKLTVHAFSLLN